MTPKNSSTTHDYLDNSSRYLSWGRIKAQASSCSSASTTMTHSSGVGCLCSCTVVGVCPTTSCSDGVVGLCTVVGVCGSTTPSSDGVVGLCSCRVVGVCGSTTPVFDAVVVGLRTFVDSGVGAAATGILLCRFVDGGFVVRQQNRPSQQPNSQALHPAGCIALSALKDPRNRSQDTRQVLDPKWLRKLYFIPPTALMIGGSR